MTIAHGLGWLPDVPSVKDYTPETPQVANLLANTTVGKHIHAARTHGTGSAVGGAAAAVAPALVPAVDLRAYCSPIEDQKNIGSCTANAAVALLEYYEKRAFNTFIDASRLFVYKTSRNLLGWTGDTGAYLRTAMEALVLFGAPPEKYMPYDTTKFDVEPSAFCYAFAADYQALTYYRLDPAGFTGQQVLDNVKAFLASGLPSMFGFPVYDEFMHVPANGLVAYPAKTSKYYGGHAQVAVGYDDNLMIGPDKGALLIRNSWGTNWGVKGYAWMSYKYVTGKLAQDWWSLIKAEWVNTGNF